MKIDEVDSEEIKEAYQTDPNEEAIEDYVKRMLNILVDSKLEGDCDVRLLLPSD